MNQLQKYCYDEKHSEGEKAVQHLYNDMLDIFSSLVSTRYENIENGKVLAKEFMNNFPKIDIEENNESY